MQSRSGALAAMLLLPQAFGCASTPHRRVTFAQAGLDPAQEPRAERPRTRLETATRELLAAIERETGERPALEPDAAPGPDPADARRLAKGWSAERTALASELMRALDTREGTVGTVRRARAALRWDLALGARWSAVDRRLVDAALAAADAALAPSEPSAPAEPTLDWPVDPVHVTSAFGLREDPLGDGERRHVGVDLAAAEGQRVLAAGDGTVVFCGRRGGYGLHAVVRHGPLLATRYAHLSRLAVREGQKVERGDLVGNAGQTGRATGPHLHFELWVDGVPTDPAERLDGPQPAARR